MEDWTPTQIWLVRFAVGSMLVYVAWWYRDRRRRR